MAGDLQGLARTLEASLDPAQNKQGLSNVSSNAAQTLKRVSSGACDIAAGKKTSIFHLVTPYSRFGLLQRYHPACQRFVFQKFHQEKLDSKALFRPTSRTKLSVISGRRWKLQITTK